MKTTFIDVPFDDVQPGDWALHVGGHLDSREVVAASDDAVYLNLLGQWSGPYPKKNYIYRRQVDTP